MKTYESQNPTHENLFLNIYLLKEITKVWKGIHKVWKIPFMIFL